MGRCPQRDPETVLGGW